ncbi:MFS transporter [Roseateles sp.]|uniref:MFS transporter n=1 Tax=Roseateles sp. TaxID=1971397 RepID=UPI002DFCF49D|nr:MFS transporter [Roseateles sp.]
MPPWKNAVREHYRWIVVAAGGLLGCVAIGALFSLPVLLRPIAQATGWSATGISTAMTLAFVALAAGSMAWGALSDRIGPRAVVFAGTLLIAAGLVAASLAPSLPAFQLCFGGVIGLGAAAVFAPLMACVTGWFDTRRSLAVSLVSAGMGMAPLTMSPLVAWLVRAHDWRVTLQIVASLVVGVMAPLSLLVRRPPALARPAEAAAPHEAGLSVGQAVRSAPFLVLVLTSFLTCATHSGPIFHTVSYAVTCGIPLMAAVSIYSLEGLAGMGGRLVFGLLGDRFGAARTLVVALLAQALVVLGYLYARQLAAFYTVAGLFGFTYAGVMPLFAVIARENFPLRMMGTVIGGTTMASSIGMALGPVLGGLIYDSFSSYAGLFIGAFALGIGATQSAVAFARLPSRGAVGVGTV